MKTVCSFDQMLAQKSIMNCEERMFFRKKLAVLIDLFTSDYKIFNKWEL